MSDPQMLHHDWLLTHEFSCWQVIANREKAEFVVKQSTDICLNFVNTCMYAAKVTKSPQASQKHLHDR